MLPSKPQPPSAVPSLVSESEILQAMSGPDLMKTYIYLKDRLDHVRRELVRRGVAVVEEG